VKKLLTVTLFTGLLTLVRMASGFVIAKVVAIHTGPSGMAMLGQVQSLFSALNGVVAAPCGNGLVRYTAENQEAGLVACAPWWRASARWVLCLLAVVIPLSCILAKSLAVWLFGDIQYSWLVWLTALALPLSVINTLIASVINGQQQYRRYVALGMLSVLIATGVMLVMILQANLDGALASAAVFSAISGLIMLIGSLRQPWLKLQYWWGGADWVHIKGIGGYVLMAVTSALTVPVSLMLVRNILVDQVGWEQAGHWQAVWKISEVYLGVISMALGIYYLPRLSTLQDSTSVIKEIKNAVKVIMPLVILLALIVYFLRDISISILFTEDFRPATKLFAVQLIGDVIKILALLYAYPMLSRGATKWFVLTEVVFSFLFVLLSFYMIQFYGVQGANFAYVINYSVYLIFVYLNLNNLFR
jgi:O-antigen/teichoic acid export membrane protein